MWSLLTSLISWFIKMMFFINKALYSTASARDELAKIMGAKDGGFLYQILKTIPDDSKEQVEHDLNLLDQVAPKVWCFSSLSWDLRADPNENK